MKDFLVIISLMFFDEPLSIGKVMGSLLILAGAAAFALLGESFSSVQLLGAGLVIVAIAVAQRPAGAREAVPPAQ